MLDSDLDINDNVKALELSTEVIDAGTKCTLSGWGTLSVSSLVATNLP
jgi:hypothetical protein